MRALLSLLTVGAVGSGAFALSELRPPQPHPPVVAQPPTREPEPQPQPLSTWHAPTPFGGVPSQPMAQPAPPVLVMATPPVTGDVDSDDVPDVIDRCPEDGDGSDDDDGCPDRVPTEIQLDGPRRIEVDGRIITLQMETIIY